ncbi:MAG: hypothetical protein R2845_14810 [Thermomicrobiales bacterium]
MSGDPVLDNQSDSQTVQVLPAADFDNLDVVAVIIASDPNEVAPPTPTPQPPVTPAGRNRHHGGRVMNPAIPDPRLRLPFCLPKGFPARVAVSVGEGARQFLGWWPIASIPA